MSETNIYVEVISINNRRELLEFDKFANKHWGEHSHDGSPESDFFDIPKWVVVAKEKDTVVGELYIFSRKVRFEGKSQKFIGIGGVVTHTDHRHLGIATKMLNHALRFAGSNGFEYAILCTDIEKIGKLYEGFGFKQMTNGYAFTDKNGVVKTETGGMIAPLINLSKVKIIQNSKNILNVGISNF